MNLRMPGYFPAFFLALLQLFYLHLNPSCMNFISLILQIKTFKP